jgi:translocation and assembly module TamB
MSGFRILKRLGRYSLWVFLCLLLTISAFLWYITTDSFQQMVRRRLIASVEHATGGRVELGSFHVVPLHFQVEVRNLTIHGREGPSERPLVQVDSMTAVVDLSSVLGLRMAFRSLVLVHPVVHILYYPDGSTNQPVPQEKPGSTFDQLFAISIHRLEVRRGEVFIQEQRVPVDFVSNDVEARLDYSFLHRRYSGDISVGKAETQFAGYRPLAWAAKTDFSIGAEEIQLRSFSATSERSQLQGGGTISDFRHPVFKGTYDLVLDLQQAASILRRPRATSGTFRMRGSASWSSQTYSTAGDFDLKDLLWSDPEFTAKDFSAGGKFSFDPRKIALTQVQGKFLRGTFTSEVEVSDWNGLEKPVRMSKQSTKQSPQRGTAVIKARDMSVADLLSSLGSRFRSIKGERFSGTLSGSSEIRWKDSVANAEINSSISITRPARVVAGELPLAASTHFTYRLHPAVLEISDLAANTPATQIRAVGTISNSNSLRVSVSSDNIGEWKALTSNLFPQGLPLLVAGRAAFNGSVAGIVASPAFNGNLQVYDFDTSMARPGSSPTLVHWDSLKADLQLSAASLVFRNALFRRAEASLLLDGSVGLRDWETQPSSAIHLRADAEKFSASDLASLSGQNISATGIINARIELSGTLSTPQGQGTALWKSGSLVGYSFDTLTASTNLGGTRVTFNSLEITRGRSRVSGKGWYDLSTRAFDGTLNGNDFDIADVAPLEQSRVKVAGIIDFSAQASGTLERPDVTARLHIHNVAFNGEAAGDYLIDAVTHGPDMHLSGHSQFDKAELSIDGNVRLRELWPAHIDFHFNHLDVDSFLESYLHGHITGHSAVAGDLVLQGPLRDPRNLTLIGNLTDLYADVEKVKIRNDGPLRFTLSEQMLTINSLHLIGENTDFSATGTIQLSGGQLNLHGNGRIGLQLVQSYDPDLSGSGSISGQVNVTGLCRLKMPPSPISICPAPSVTSTGRCNSVKTKSPLKS